MYVANVDETGFINNSYLDAVLKIAQTEDAVALPICNKMEAEIVASMCPSTNSFFLVVLQFSARKHPLDWALNTILLCAVQFDFDFDFPCRNSTWNLLYVQLHF